MCHGPGRGDVGTGTAGAAPGPRRGTALATRPPASQPAGSQASRAGSQADGSDASGMQPAKWAHRPDKRNGKADKRLKDHRDKPNHRGNGKSVRPRTPAARFWSTESHRPGHRLVENQVLRGPSDRPSLLRAAATAVGRWPGLSLAGLAPRVRGRPPPCPRPWPLDGGCFSCPLPPAPSGRDFRHLLVPLSASPAASTGAWDVTAFSFLLLSAPLRTLEARHGSSLLVPVPAVVSGSPTGLAPWPSLVAPTGAPSPVLGAGCRPGVVDGMGAVSSAVAKMRRAVSRMGSGSVPVAAAAMPVVDRPTTATATSSPTRRRRPGLPVAPGMARRARVTARSSASTASWPASSAGLGGAAAAANSAATSAYPAAPGPGEGHRQGAARRGLRPAPADPDPG